MKKIIACVALVMSTSAALAAQEMNVNIYSRLDANKPWPLESSTLSNNRINWGNTSLYLLTDGSFSDKLSFDVSLNLANAANLNIYRNTGSCTETNWLQWADLTYSIDPHWSISAGKELLLENGWELEPYDFEYGWNLHSMDWNIIDVYQWGGKVSFAPSEEHTYALQLTSSPLREMLWKGNEIAVSAQTRHTFGNYGGILSMNYIQADEESYGFNDFWIFTFGNKISNDRLTAALDYTAKTQDFGSLNSSFTGFLSANFCDKAFEIGVIGGLETISSKCPDFFGWGADWSLEGEAGYVGIVPYGIYSAKDYIFGGLFAHYYPSEGLSVHAEVSYNNYMECVSTTIGLLYNFSFKLF